MKTQLTQKFTRFQKVSLSMVVLMLLNSTNTFAAGLDVQKLLQQVKELSGPAYQVFSIIIGAVALISFFRNLKDMIGGDKEAMQRFGGVLVIAAVWFFLVPPLMSWLFSQASNSQTF